MIGGTQAGAEKRGNLKSRCRCLNSTTVKSLLHKESCLYKNKHTGAPGWLRVAQSVALSVQPSVSAQVIIESPESGSMLGAGRSLLEDCLVSLCPSPLRSPSSPPPKYINKSLKTKQKHTNKKRFRGLRASLYNN